MNSMINETYPPIFCMCVSWSLWLASLKQHYLVKTNCYTSEKIFNNASCMDVITFCEVLLRHSMKRKAIHVFVMA
jgi:hypothetical protein